MGGATEENPLQAAAETVDGVFRALSDPTRRHVLERLSRSPAAVSELAAPFDMAMPSFVAHPRVLEGSGMVRSKKTKSEARRVGKECVRTCKQREAQVH